MLRLSTLGIPTGLGRTKFEDLLIQLFCLSLLLIPVGFLTIKSWVTTLSLIAFLLAITLLVMNAKRVTLTKLDVLIFTVFASPFMADLIAQLLREEWIPRELDAPSRMLIFIPIYCCLRIWNVELDRKLVLSVSAGLIFALPHIILLPIYHWGERWASEPSDPNTLGLFVAVMLAYILPKALDGAATSGQKAVLSLAVVSGISILLMTQSRGAWLAGIGALVLSLWMHRKGSKKPLLGWFLLIAVTITVLTTINPKLNARAKSIPSDVIGWVLGDSAPTSAGVRLNMVLLTGKILMNQGALVHGHGDRGYREQAGAIATTPAEMIAARSIYETPHNEVLNKLLKSGILGATTALLVLLFPAITVSKVLTPSKSKITFQSYIAFILGVVIASLTMGVFGLAYTSSFYAIVSAVCLAALIPKKE